MTRPLPLELQHLIDGAVAMVRERLEAGGEFPGHAFIDAPNVLGHPDPKVGRLLRKGLIVIPMTEFPDKDMWARFVRTMSSLVEARFVMVVTEVWVTAGDNTEETDRLLKQYHEVRLIPGRHEAMMVQIETHEGFWQGIAYLRNLGGGAAPRRERQADGNFSVAIEGPKGTVTYPDLSDDEATQLSKRFVDGRTFDTPALSQPTINSGRLVGLLGSRKRPTN
jgi:hypothetical protein